MVLWICYINRLTSHPVRGAWIEIQLVDDSTHRLVTSHPVRGAWIEIINSYELDDVDIVASRKGCVD